MRRKLLVHRSKRLMIGVSAGLFAFLITPFTAFAFDANNGDFEAEHMTVVKLSGATGGNRIIDDGQASGGKAVNMYSNTVGTITISVPESSKLTLTARGLQCQGAPNVKIAIDDVVIANHSIASTTYAAYTTTTNIPAGNHKFTVTYDNDYLNSTCDRNLIIDKVEFTPAADTTPPTAPTGLAITSSGNDVSLEWTDNTEQDFAYYAVRRSAISDTNNTGAWTRLAPNYTVSNALDADLANGMYYYYVTAIDTAGNVSARSAAVSVTVDAGTVIWSDKVNETGTLSNVILQQCTPDRIQVVNDPSGINRRVSKMTVYDTDIAPCQPPPLTNTLSRSLSRAA